MTAAILPNVLSLFKKSNLLIRVNDVLQYDGPFYSPTCQKKKYIITFF